MGMRWTKRDAYEMTMTIDKALFQQLMQLKTDYLAERLYHVLKDDMTDTAMSFYRLCQKVRELNAATFTFKLHFLFRLFDVTNRGAISRDHLHTLLHSCVQESTVSLDDADITCLSDALFDDITDDASDVISWEQWSRHFHLYPSLIRNFTLRVPPLIDSPDGKEGRCFVPRHLTLTYFLNNKVKVIFTFIFLTLNLGAGCFNAWLYRDHNWLIMMARFSGMCINVSCAVALCLTLRKGLTLLHRPPLAACLPLDHHVLFHKMAGYFIVLSSLVHTLSHVANAAIYLSESTHLTLFQCLFTLQAEIGWVAGFTPLSGVLLFLLLLLLFLCSMEYVRRWSCFEVFYWTHKLSLPILLLTVLHAAHFWKWILVPFLLYCVEQGLKLKAWCACSGHLLCHSATLFPSGVTELRVSGPGGGFVFQAGDFLYLNIPAIARFEWHPFTLSSAPQNTDAMTLHVSSVGQWTRRLYSYFENQSTNPKNQTTVPTIHIQDCIKQTSNNSGTDSDLSRLEQSAYDNEGFQDCVYFGLRENVPERLDSCKAPVGYPGQKLSGERRMDSDIVHSHEHGENSVISNHEHTDKPALTVPEEGQTSEQTGKGQDRGLEAGDEWDGCYKSDVERKQEEHKAVSPSKPKKAITARDQSAGTLYHVRLPVYVDGPYGTPSRHILRAEHAILIGSGIGVTPFASVLQSMVHCCCQTGKQSPSGCFTHGAPKTLKKVDFIWINRHLHGFDWLLPVLAKLEREQSRDGGPGHVINMQMYLTSAPSREDVRGVGLQAAGEALFRRQKADFVTGLHTPTHLGRPRFDQIFSDIAKFSVGRIRVFFCGSASLRDTVKQACHRHGLHFCREHF